MTLFATSRQVSRWLNPPINTRSWKKEKETLEAEIIRLREVHSQKLSKEAQKLMNLPFRRAITKKEQADMGKLKKKRTRPDRGAPDDGAGPGNGGSKR